jgi:AcrR family transcriptional regulator
MASMMDELGEAQATPAASRGARRRAGTRRRLLAAARVVFAREGLDAATIAQITDEADTGFGTFYLHFATKEDAYRAVIVEGFGELEQALARVSDEASQRGAAWHETIAPAVRVYVEFAARNRALFTVMFAGGGAGLGIGHELGARFASSIAARLFGSSAGATHHDASDPYPYPPMPVAIATVAALTRAILWSLAHDDAPPQALETLIETMSRFITAALWGQMPA